MRGVEVRGSSTCVPGLGQNAISSSSALRRMASVRFPASGIVEGCVRGRRRSAEFDYEIALNGTELTTGEGSASPESAT